MTPAPTPQSRPKREIVFWLALAAVFLAMAWRQHQFVDRYAVNMMYWDQWGIYGPMFEERGWWDSFDYQHGPHRQGAGALVTRVLANASDWDSRWDAFGVSWTLIGAAVAALFLVVRCGARTGVALAAVPLLYLNLRQYEQFAGAANISHGAMPLLLLTLYGLAWFVKSRGVRLALLATLSFLAIFTGFGFYVGAISVLLFVLEGVQLARQMNGRGAVHAGLALVAVLAAWWLFFQNYRIEGSSSGVKQTLAQTGEVLHFVGVMLANSHGLPGAGAGATTVGLAIYGILVALCIYQGVQLVRQGVDAEPRRVVIFCLTAFVAMYCVSAALGRLGEGIEAARASRYVTLMIPAGLAVCLQLATSKKLWVSRGVLGGYVALLAVLTLSLRPADVNQAETFRAGREAWKRAYLSSHDEMQADALSGRPVYPDPILSAQLKYLEQHRLNLFKSTGK